MNYKHGYARKGQVHRLHSIWRGMHKRCSPASNKHARARYADRGIVVCLDWAEFSAFKTWAEKNGYADDLTIERKDVNGPYSPDNCCWATKKAQARNRTTTRRIEINGLTRSLAGWLEISGVTRSAFHAREARGWPLTKALGTCPHFELAK